MHSLFSRAFTLLAIELLLVIPNCGGWSGSTTSKTTEEYWAKTHLEPQFLYELLQEKYCYNKTNDFLACINAVSQMAQKQNRYLSFTGELKPLSRISLKKRLTEHSELSMWRRYFDRAIKSNIDVKKVISFHKILDQIFDHQVPRSEKAYYASIGINGFLSVAMDPHTYILPVDMYEDTQAQPENKQSGMGVIARRSGDRLFVRKVFDKSPAAVAGIKKGDRILSLNGIEISSLPTNRLNDFLRLKDRDRVLVKAERKGGSYFTEIIKAENIIPNVMVQWIQETKGLGLISINRFTKDTCETVKTELSKFKKWGLSGLILDLRDNPGGQVEEAACVTGLFVKKGKLLFETRYLNAVKKTDFYFSKDEPMYQGPVVVLINSGSASAAEIVAGSLKDQGRAVLMGERSFGKGSFQDGKVWGQNDKIVLFETQGFYYFPSGWTPQLVGLIPDIEVKFSAIDPQREEDLYLNPLRPYDYWDGPQSLSWLYSQNKCLMTDESNAFTEFNEDPQLRTALTYISCQDSYGKNGSL